MNHEHEHYHKPQSGGSWWLTRNGIATALLIAIIGIYLLTEHLMHVFEALPWLILGGCLLMHLFMHHGHGGRHKDNDRGS
jgi:hypothetical protein